MQSDIVIGLQFGDEGKGKIVYHLIKTGGYDFCVRYNGGPNAGHTVYVDDKKVVTHQIPTGAIHRIPSLIGSSCMLDPRKLDAELKMCESIGITNIRDLVKVAYNCHVIQESHIEQDKKTDTVGSTHCGMGPAYTDKYARVGQRVRDVYKDNVCGCEIVDPSDYLYSKKGAKILFEGAQGYLLDVNWGQYPYVTSTHCDVGFITSTGMNPRSIRDVYGVCKLYCTYVGKMQFQPKDPVFDKIAELGQEFGSTTGRKRQCNWLNLDSLIRSIRVNGVNKLIINKCDILEKLGVFKLIHKGETKEFGSLDDMKVYITMVINEDTALEIVFSSTPLGM
jgi:adenylosuccinate synthase